MTDGSFSLHEEKDALTPETIDRHRAIASIMEELEAVDWYDQRAQATQDAELRAILEHNRDEEKEHAAMALEWLRRNDTVMNKQLKTYLFTEGNILGIEEEDAGSTAPSGNGKDGSLGIGSLREAASK
jgi:ferritin-like protein